VSVSEIRPGPPPPPPPRLPKYRYRLRSVWEVAPWVLVQVYPRGVFGARLLGTARRFRALADIAFEDELPQDTDARVLVSQLDVRRHLSCNVGSKARCPAGLRLCTVELGGDAIDCLTKGCGTAPESIDFWVEGERIGGTYSRVSGEFRPAIDGSTCTSATALLDAVTDPALAKMARDRGWEDTAAVLDAMARAARDGADAAAAALGALAVPLAISTQLSEEVGGAREAARPYPIRALRVIISGPQGARFTVRALASGTIHARVVEPTEGGVAFTPRSATVALAEQREVLPGQPVDLAITPPDLAELASRETRYVRGWSWAVIDRRVLQALVHVIPPPGTDKFGIYVTLAWGSESPAADDVEWGSAGGIHVSYDLAKRAPSFDIKPLGARYVPGGKLVAELLVSTPGPGCHQADVEVYLPHDPGSAPHRERVEVCGPPSVKTARVQAELRPRYVEPQKWVAARVTYSGRTVAEVSWRMEWRPKAEVEVTSLSVRAEGPDPLRPEELAVTADVVNWTTGRKKVKICPRVSVLERSPPLYVQYDEVKAVDAEPCAELELDPLELAGLEWRAPRAACQGTPATVRIYRRERGAQPAQAMAGPPGGMQVWREERRPGETWCGAFRLYEMDTEGWIKCSLPGGTTLAPDPGTCEMAKRAGMGVALVYAGVLLTEDMFAMPGEFCVEVLGKKACARRPTRRELSLGEMAKRYGGCVSYTLGLDERAEKILGRDAKLELHLCDGRSNPWLPHEVVLDSPAREYKLALAFWLNKKFDRQGFQPPIPDSIYVAWVPVQGESQIPGTSIHGVWAPLNLPGETPRWAEVKLVPLLFFGGRAERVPGEFMAALHVQLPWYALEIGGNPRQRCYERAAWVCEHLRAYASTPCVELEWRRPGQPPLKAPLDPSFCATVTSMSESIECGPILADATGGVTVRVLKSPGSTAWYSGCQYDPVIRAFWLKEVRGECAAKKRRVHYKFGTTERDIEVEYLECMFPPSPLARFFPAYAFKIARGPPPGGGGAGGEPRLAVRPASGNYAVPPGGRFEVALDADAREWELGLRLGIGLTPDSARETAVEVDLVDAAGRRARRFRVSGPARIAFRLPERLPAQVCIYLQPLVNGLPRDDRTYCFV
jgi:hypothetical protein